jgi:hypothetical protein
MNYLLPKLSIHKWKDKIYWYFLLHKLLHGPLKRNYIKTGRRFRIDKSCSNGGVTPIIINQYSLIN